jgi:hypothetical protein
VGGEAGAGWKMRWRQRAETTGRRAPAGQISQRAHHRRAADDSLTGKKPQASKIIRLEIERVIGGRKQAATSAQSISSARFMHCRLGSSADPAGYATVCGDNTGNTDTNLTVLSWRFYRQGQSTVLGREGPANGERKKRESDFAKPGFRLAHSQYSSLDFHTLFLVHGAGLESARRRPLSEGGLRGGTIIAAVHVQLVKGSSVLESLWTAGGIRSHGPALASPLELSGLRVGPHSAEGAGGLGHVHKPSKTCFV